MTDERPAKVRTLAAWLADRFVILRSKAGKLHCDDCKFDPHEAFPSGAVKPRSLLDVHHKRPIEEGVRYTTIDDLALLCPTCHRIEHARMKLATKVSVSSLLVLCMDFDMVLFRLSSLCASPRS